MTDNTSILAEAYYNDRFLRLSTDDPTLTVEYALARMRTRLNGARSEMTCPPYYTAEAYPMSQSPKKATIGVGLVGLGRHGLRYARHLLHDVPDGRLVAVCRRDVQEGARFSAESGVRYYRHFPELIHDPDVEAVVVVTPPSAAKSICMEGIQAKKPLLIEKPLALEGAEAREMVNAAQASGIPLMTAHTMRFEPAIRTLKTALPTVGVKQYLSLTTRMEPRAAAITSSADYGGKGVLLEIGIHLIDLVRFLTGEEVVEVRCGVDQPKTAGPESWAWASLRTSGGFVSLLDVSRVAPGRVGRAEWIGGTGQLVADWAGHRFVRFSAGDQREEQAVEVQPTVVATLSAFLCALAKGSPMPITGLDGQRAVEIADACYRSAAQGSALVSVPHM